MNLRYHPRASEELEEAYNWYELQQAGLGLRLVAEVELAIKRILHFPHSNPLLEKGFRRAVLPAFPFGIFYKITGDEIDVYAVANLHRMPNYWAKRRLK